MKKTYVGIDISKEKFSVAINNGKGYSVKDYPYKTPEDIGKFVKILDSDLHCCVVEATGVYHKRMAYALCDAGIDVCVVNPASVKYFSKMKNSITKTDKQDAKLIAAYGEQEKPVLYEKPEEEQDNIAQRRTLLEMLLKQLQMLKNQLESLSHQPRPDKITKQILEKQIDTLEQQIKELKESIEQATKDLHGEKFKLLQTIPAVGKEVASALAFALSNFQGIDLPNATKAFCKYVGVVPVIFESGKSVSRIQHIGRSSVPSLRQKLYIATCACINHSKYKNPIKDIYLRLREKGKTYKQAVTAAMHKVVRIAMAVWTSGKPFDPLFLPQPNNISTFA